jgi:N,N'-diacetylchitobiose transport system substrate-binding protein
VKITRLAAAAVVAAMALTACGSSDDSSGTLASSDKGKKTEVRLWLVGTDTPQEVRDYAKTTFEAEHPEATLVIEEQVWDGLVDKLTTALSATRRRSRSPRPEPSPI